MYVGGQAINTRKAKKAKQLTLFPFKMVAKLVQRNVRQNTEQTQNPTMGATINNESTTTEPLSRMDSSPSQQGPKMYPTGTKPLLQIPLLLKLKKTQSPQGGSSPIELYHHRETIQPN